MYAGGGIVAANAAAELREFVELTDAPAVNTLMGLGALPSDHPELHLACPACTAATPPTWR